MLLPEIEFGARLCQRIKKIYYCDQAWSMVLCKEIASKFTALKKQARICFPELSEAENLLKIEKWEDSDLKDMIDSAQIQKETKPDLKINSF